jgi:uncharacterized phage protein gp47/JayE
MTDYGMTNDGFVIKRMDVIVSEMQETFRTVFGASLNLLDTELVGQVIKIFSEREALLWEHLESNYNMPSPSTASGVALDNVVSITGIQRLQATKSLGTVTCYGTLGTVIPVGTIFSVDNNADVRFVTDQVGTIADGTNEIQDITFDAVPDAGDFTLSYDGEETGVLNSATVAADVQTQLNNLAALSGVSVTGDFAGGFTIEFAGSDGSQDHPLIVVASNSLTALGVDVNITIAETVPGELPNVDITVEAETAGDITAYAGTLTVIETPVSGLDSVTNALDCTGGTDIETDAELRMRRLETLANPGAGTVDSIRANILEIDEVEACVVYTNREDVVDGDGRPPHSLEAVVLGGDDQDIWDTLWAYSPAGIEFVGTEIGTVVDSQGFEQSVNFNRPSEVEIYMEIDLDETATFPSGGEDSVKASVLAYADENFSIGDEVVTTEFYGAIHETVGIGDINIRIATSNVILVQQQVWLSNFVTGNVISGKVGGTDITPVTFAVSHANTLSLLASEIALNAKVASAVVSGTDTIIVTSVAAGDPAALGNFTVSGGASQPEDRIITTSHSDDNITISPSEISAWDSSRIVITQI